MTTWTVLLADLAELEAELLAMTDDCVDCAMTDDSGDCTPDPCAPPPSWNVNGGEWVPPPAVGEVYPPIAQKGVRVEELPPSEVERIWQTVVQSARG